VSEEYNETQGPVIRDKRRIDPETGQLREPRESAAPSAAAADGARKPTEPSQAEVQLAERTADLQRLQAEYVNYKRRVDRDREATRQASVASVLTSLLPVLDDIGRAREHEELTGGFKAVAESLERTVTSLGLVAFGAVGDAFDPRIHEALMHTYSSDVEGPVCVAVLQVGYRLGDRIVRPARVAVAEPEESPQQPAEQPPVDPAVDDATGVETDGDDVEQLDALTPDSNDSNA
jgi:molecular chaperone GrpE